MLYLAAVNNGGGSDDDDGVFDDDDDVAGVVGDDDMDDFAVDNNPNILFCNLAAESPRLFNNAVRCQLLLSSEYCRFIVLVKRHIRTFPSL